MLERHDIHFLLLFTKTNRTSLLIALVADQDAKRGMFTCPLFPAFKSLSSLQFKIIQSQFFKHVTSHLKIQFIAKEIVACCSLHGYTVKSWSAATVWVK